jgi:hypothetical protein
MLLSRGSFFQRQPIRLGIRRGIASGKKELAELNLVPPNEVVNCRVEPL